MDRRKFVKGVGCAGLISPLSYLVGQEIADSVKLPSGPLEGTAHRAVWGRNGVVATAHGLASLAGIRMLMNGGNAIDAAIAASAALNVVEPYNSGMGGFGGYMIIYLASTGKVVALDGMGISPAASGLGKITEEECDEGYKAPIVPGSIGMWAEALNRYGTKSIGDVFDFAIELAEGGFPLTRYGVKAFTEDAAKLAKFPNSAAVFMPAGRVPHEGEVVTQKDLARSFRKIAINGPHDFYTGEIGQKIVDCIQRHNGFLTLADMAAYKPRWRDPIQTSFHGHTLYSMPPGSCGMTMFEALNIMDGYELEKLDLWSADFVHLWIEAMKLAFMDDDRYNTGKDNAEIPVSKIISHEYAERQRARMQRRTSRAFPGPVQPGIGTTPLAAADRWGNVVAFTQSHVSGFGSGVVVGDTGILLNNGHRYGFVLDPTNVNALAGGQHAKGVMCPTIVMKGDQVLMGMGAAGGYTIPQTTGQVIIKALVYGLDIQRAIASPRILLNRAGGRVPVESNEQTYLEVGFPAAVNEGLKKFGHNLTTPGNGGAVQAVYLDPASRAFSGGADPRRDGHAIAW